MPVDGRSVGRREKGVVVGKAVFGAVGGPPIHRRPRPLKPFRGSGSAGLTSPGSGADSSVINRCHAGEDVVT